MKEDDIRPGDLVRFQWYRGTVRLRRGKGWAIKPECELLDGKVLVLEAMWRIGEDDSSVYVGEWAMGKARELEQAGIVWMASGDLVDLTPCEAPC